MKHNIALFLIGLLVLFTGCIKQDTIEITPENLIVNSEVSSAVVKTSGFICCEIRFPDTDKKVEMFHREEGNIKYEGEWFKLNIVDDWKDLNFEFSENTTKEDRSATVILRFGDMTNRFKVTQKGSNK